VRFGKFEVSRLIMGSNQFYGYGHFNDILRDVMKQWYTADKVVEVAHRCEKYGMTAANYAHLGRAQADWERYRAEGGKMQLITQGMTDNPLVETVVKPIAVWTHGSRTDRAWRSGKMDSIREYCKKWRDAGVMVGVGSHSPEFLATVEEQGWDVDFYAGCVYNRERPAEELRRLLGGELPEMPGEVYLQDDPPRMYKFMRQTKKPCVAFKILAAGRVRNPEAAFKQAFQSIKPNDLVCVGMFPRIKDEIKENAWWATKHGGGAS